jgi:hypothetical protein
MQLYQESNKLLLSTYVPDLFAGPTARSTKNIT